MMGALDELNRFLDTRNGKVVLVLCYLFLVYLLYQSGTVCSIQMEKLVKQCNARIHEVQCGVNISALMEADINATD